MSKMMKANRATARLESHNAATFMKDLVCGPTLEAAHLLPQQGISHHSMRFDLKEVSEATLHPAYVLAASDLASSAGPRGSHFPRQRLST